MLEADLSQSDEEFETAQHHVEIVKPLNEENNEGLNPKKIFLRTTTNEHVHLKFQKLNHFNANRHSHSKNHFKNICKNISFESEKAFQNQFSNDYSCEEGRSSLGHYYQNHAHAELLYRKSRNIGTEWISQQEYFTSLFVNPSFIQKAKNKILFGNFDGLLQTQGVVDFSNQLGKKSVIEQIQFDSDFQSGNLFAVYKVGILQYDLLLQNDINTKGNTQWFYFRIKNPPHNRNIKLNIVNFRKPDSLFNYGMLPCVHSSESQKKHNIGWVRKGSKVKYFRNNHQIQNSRKSYYTLTFTVSTEYQNDTLKIAQCYPYTISDLDNYLAQIQKVNYKKQLCSKVTVLSKTLLGNKIQSLIIKEATKIKNSEAKPIIIVLARQHPGQTPGSFIMEGIIDYFLSKEKDAQFLRKFFEIRVIPMVNPDGVQAGNYRTNLYGIDLNRKWDCSIKQKEKQKQNTLKAEAYQIAFIKRYILTFAKGKQIAYILDFHGHSRKLNSFFYGNSQPMNPSDVKIFPYVCSKLSSMIRYEDCTFNVEEQKRTTARIQLLMNYKATNIFTFQASFFGYINKHKEKKHFTIQNYKSLGMVIGKAIYLCERKKQENQLETKEKLLYDKWFKELSTNSFLIKAGQREDSGSQSCPDECQILQIQRQILQEDEYYQNQQKINNTTSKVKRQRGKAQSGSGKEPQKTLRQMQVLDIARVNSVFPNDVLALVPNTFYLKSNIFQKQKKSVQVQTDPCPIIKVYESCKGAEQDNLGLCINENISQVKSMIIETTKFKSTVDVMHAQEKYGNFFQTTLRNFSTINPKNTYQKQLFQNPRHLSALKKSTDIRRHFKKILTQHQLIKPKSLLSRNETRTINKKVHKYVQTIISFQKQSIVRHSQVAKNQINSKNSETLPIQSQQKLCESKVFLSPERPEREQHNKFWTVSQKRKSLGVQCREISSKHQFRKSTLVSSQMTRNHSNNIYENEKLSINERLMENWRIKKKSLI